MYLNKIGNVQLLSSRSVFRTQNCLFHVSCRRSTNSTDHYLTLEIDKNATRQQIKQSYYKLSKQYHPDVNKDSDSEEKFKSLQAAYHILGDAERKKDYDRSLRPGNYKPGAYAGGGGGGGSGNPFQGGVYNNSRRTHTPGGGGFQHGKNSTYDFDEYYRQHYQRTRSGGEGGGSYTSSTQFNGSGKEDLNSYWTEFEGKQTEETKSINQWRRRRTLIVFLTVLLMYIFTHQSKRMERQREIHSHRTQQSLK